MKKLLIILVVLLANACTIAKDYKQEDRIATSETGFLIGWECSSLPISVSYDSSISKTYEDALFDSVHYVNKALGNFLLSGPSKSFRSNFYVSISNMEYEYGKAGRTSISLDELKRYIIHANIGVQNFGKSYQTYYNVLVHEFGHVFGLKHDEDSCSIMYSTITSSCTFKRNTYSKYDVHILKNFYQGCEK